MTDLGLLKFPQTLTNAYQLNQLIITMGTLEVSKEKPLLVVFTDKKQKRSNAINALSHLWYAEVAAKGGEYDERGVKNMAKLRWGVPILRKNQDFNDTWLKLMAGFKTYEEQIELMNILPVTSLMTDGEMSAYMNRFKLVMGTKYELTDPRLQGIVL